MSVEIEIRTGVASWPSVKPLFEAVWPREVVEKLSWGHIVFAPADLRVLVEDDERLVCQVGITRREATWDGRKVRIGGIGGVSTHPDFRRRGFASVALNAALQTLKEERATDFALLFCEPHQADFYTSRGWKPFVGEVFAEQAGQRARFDALLPFVSYLKRAPHTGEIDLCGLPW
ncbi:GNAT family N-acetyltransferase [Tardiphaga sp.]|uniref:GNAT family N-acetyltransferase n=1 Tax=Tardiphaga sp. TaxID=1926292 RepID=UPI002604EA8B|nr:GNAT family N-acetyltransferase [Tardiphaga sp.]MDB5616663.1 acetyltransferase [Tardiphaga sp.]